MKYLLTLLTIAVTYVSCVFVWEWKQQRDRDKHSEHSKRWTIGTTKFEDDHETVDRDWDAYDCSCGFTMWVDNDCESGESDTTFYDWRVEPIKPRPRVKSIRHRQPGCP